jgi:hypothetical protein
MAARREPHLALASEQHVPGLKLLLADKGADPAERTVGQKRSTLCYRRKSIWYVAGALLGRAWRGRSP